MDKNCPVYLGINAQGKIYSYGNSRKKVIKELKEKISANYNNGEDLFLVKTVKIDKIKPFVCFEFEPRKIASEEK